jgi:hypothetical protein
MTQPQSADLVYLCPMHTDVRRSALGKCPQCGMDLLLEGTRFGMLRHMLKNRMALGIMAFGMIAIMAAIMMVVTS